MTCVFLAEGRCRVIKRKISVQSGATVAGQGAIYQISCVTASGSGHHIKWNPQVQTFVKTAFAKLLRRHIGFGRPNANSDAVDKGSAQIDGRADITSQILARTQSDVG